MSGHRSERFIHGMIIGGFMAALLYAAQKIILKATRNIARGLSGKKKGKK